MQVDPPIRPRTKCPLRSPQLDPKQERPHPVVVTGEPTPSRLSSLALGTGDIDTVYHFALPELIEATHASGGGEAVNTLETLIDGQRLRDISDLPCDLAI